MAQLSNTDHRAPDFDVFINGRLAHACLFASEEGGYIHVLQKHIYAPCYEGLKRDDNLGQLPNLYARIYGHVVLQPVEKNISPTSVQSSPDAV